MMPTMLRGPAILLACLAALPLYPQCEQFNLLVNGEFTSVEGELIVAPGWIGTSTPDVNDENGPLNCTPCYVWTGVPLASPDGGTWQNLYGAEAIEQNIPTTVGQAYSVCFSYAAQGITCSGLTFDDPVGVQVYLNGVLHWTAPLDVTQFTWEMVCTDFVATSAATSVMFMPTSMDYVALDGACVTIAKNVGMPGTATNTPAIIPNPATDAVTISGVGTFDQLRVTDAAGRITLLAAVDQQVDLAPLSAGVHVIQCLLRGDPMSQPVRLVVAQ